MNRLFGSKHTHNLISGCKCYREQRNYTFTNVDGTQHIEHLVKHGSRAFSKVCNDCTQHSEVNRSHVR